MVNVDGVVYGNSRCDITGIDMNRRWRNTSKLMYPQIYEIKKRIISYKSTNKIECCFDLHGHSKKYNIFAYSCKIN
jgi:murein tripeptide amidase MpaA